MFTSRIFYGFAALASLHLLLALPAQPATVLVLAFHNSSPYPDLNWVGEGIAESLKDDFSAQNQIVFGRDSRAEALRRLSLRPDADFTKASLIRLGQVLDSDYVCYGTYDAKLPAGSSELKNSSIQISAHFIDLRKLHDGPDLAEAGKLADLSRLEEHLAWESLRYLNPAVTLPLDAFLAPQRLTRVDAEESYIRGLLSPSSDQQQKWFVQALALDPHFTNPAFELGKLSLKKKDYRQALSWFQRIPSTDPRYPEARFRMGLSAYGAADYNTAVDCFREVVKILPLNEVFNNLGAAEAQLGMPDAVNQLRHALDGDPNDPVYQFNLGVALLHNNSFDDSAVRLRAVIAQNASDAEARALLDWANRREYCPPAGKPLAVARLKTNFDATVFRQLKAMVQPKGGS